MKFLKKLIIIAIVLVGAYCVVGFFSPSDYKVERSREVNAPMEIVFEQVSKFNNWDGWSPWKEKDSSATYTITGEDGVVATKYAWSGDPETTGKGSMTVTEMILNEKFAYDLEFTEPWQMKSKGYFHLSSADEVTTINWVDEGDIPFMQRPMMLFMNLDAMMGPDFERGLFKIDSLSQIMAEDANKLKNISEVDYAGATFIGIRYDMKISEIDSSLYGSSFGKIMTYCMDKEIQIAGAPCTVTTSWNQESDSCSMLIAIPIIEHEPVADNGFEYMVVNPGKSVLYTYYGDYEGVGVAYFELENYVAGNNLEIRNIAIEEYVTDPTTVESQNEVLTNVYYLMK